MSPPSIIWQRGDPDLFPRIERALTKALEVAIPIHASAHRTSYRLTLPAEQGRAEIDVVLKRYHPRGGWGALVDLAKRGLGRSSAQREWRALEWASAHGLAIPTPLARGRLAAGDPFIVTAWIPGRSLLEALPHLDDPDWEQTCRALAKAIGALHGAGLRHGDLHAGNIRVTGSGIVLLDLQRARVRSGEAERLADLARLEFSLMRSGASPALCGTLRRACGVGSELDDAMIRFCRDHQRGRVRRRFRSGAGWSSFVPGGHPRRRGRLDSASPHALVSHLLSLDETDQTAEVRNAGRVRISSIEVDGRGLVRKSVSAGGFGRALADRFRGSAGARAFRLGQADRLISDRSAPALGYVDHFRMGLPVESELLMDRVGDEDMDRLQPRDAEQAERVARALGSWLAEDHARGLSHRDLKGGNIRVELGEQEIRFWLVDLQDLSGPAHVPEAARIEALSQLNASLGPGSFDRRSRLAALEAYAERLPFGQPLEAVAREIAQRSLSRRHRWRGEDCPCAPRGASPG